MAAFSAEAVQIWNLLGTKRKVIGSKRKRREMTAAQKLKVAQSLEKLRPSYGAEEELWKAMVQFFGLEKKLLVKILSQKDQWQKFCQQRQLGFESAGSLGSKGSRLKFMSRKIKSKGVRAPGAGMKDRFAVFQGEGEAVAGD